ncbi:hypothetical protein GCM10009801_21120 [Streptomyces albiaxialis]|uniref:Uncharacterized protein n=1 Tax=Streptomyces albiaxialis TaxID=329523 RepID=A0ABN2VSS4_9ACTN
MSVTTAAQSRPGLVRSAAGTRRPWATRPVWLVGTLATAAGAAVTEVFTLAARGLGVPMAAATGGAREAAAIPVGGFAMAVVLSSVAGVVLAMALARWAKRPARTFVIVTGVLTALSLVEPLAFTVHTAVSTQLVLALSHLVAAAVIVPPLARRLAHRRA